MWQAYVHVFGTLLSEFIEGGEFFRCVKRSGGRAWTNCIAAYAFARKLDGNIFGHTKRSALLAAE